MKTLIVTGTITLSAAACVTGQVVTTTGSVGATLVVEQFLRAANAKDLAAMGRLFGTREGPVLGRWPRAEVEQRMFAIARELTHQDFQITSEQMVPGRTEDATRLVVKLTIESRDYHVPFTLVRYKENSWLVEQIDLEVITAPRN